MRPSARSGISEHEVVGLGEGKGWGASRRVEVRVPVEVVQGEEEVGQASRGEDLGPGRAAWCKSLAGSRS